MVDLLDPAIDLRVAVEIGNGGSMVLQTLMAIMNLACRTTTGRARAPIWNNCGPPGP